MNTIMSYHFLYQRYEPDYVLPVKMEKEHKHASLDANHATTLAKNLTIICRWVIAHLMSLQLYSHHFQSLK